MHADCRPSLIDPRSSLWYIYIYIYASALYFYWIQSGYKSLCSLFDIIIISNLICICCFLKVESSKWRKPVVFYKENEWKLQQLWMKLLDLQWTQLLQMINESSEKMNGCGLCPVEVSTKHVGWWTRVQWKFSLDTSHIQN